MPTWKRERRVIRDIEKLKRSRYSVEDKIENESHEQAPNEADEVRLKVAQRVR